MVYFPKHWSLCCSFSPAPLFQLRRYSGIGHAFIEYGNKSSIPIARFVGQNRAIEAIATQREESFPSLESKER